MARYIYKGTMPNSDNCSRMTPCEAGQIGGVISGMRGLALAITKIVYPALS